MSNSGVGLFWQIADILSGRRKHWNSICAPVLLTAYQQAKSFDRRLHDVIELLLAASWTAFRADFSQGPFRRWQKCLDTRRTKQVLAIYLTYLVQVCSARGVWERLNLSEEQIWSSVISLFPEARNSKQELTALSADDLTKNISQIHLTLLSMVTKEDLIRLASSDQFFHLRYYHPKLLIDLSERVVLEISRRYGKELSRHN